MHNISRTLLFFLLLFLYPPHPSFAAILDWGTTGVSDTSLVSGILQLTNDNADNYIAGGYYFGVSPWSKDGKWIVYAAYDHTTGWDIYKINAASGIFYNLTPGFLTATESVGNPSFGTENKIYFEIKEAAGSEIWRMNSDGTAKENLTSVHGGLNEHYVKVSPDGQWMAFFSNNALWVARSDGTAAHIVSTIIQVNTPQHSWSPDSQWLVYQGVDGSSRWIYKVKVDGTENQSLTKPPIILGQQIHSWPTWSPDGQKIGFLWSLNNGTNIYYNLRTIAIDGQSLQSALDSAETSSTNWTGMSGPLSWSPDAQWLTYTKDGGGDKAIFITNGENSASTKQLTTGYADNNPSWSPSGNRILFADSGPG